MDKQHLQCTIEESRMHEERDVYNCDIHKVRKKSDIAEHKCDKSHVSPTVSNIRMKLRYDTRCYFNVRSKADISQLNLPHGTDN